MFHRMRSKATVMSKILLFYLKLWNKAFYSEVISEWKLERDLAYFVHGQMLHIPVIPITFKNTLRRKIRLYIWVKRRVLLLLTLLMLFSCVFTVRTTARLDISLLTLTALDPIISVATRVGGSCHPFWNIVRPVIMQLLPLM